MSRQTISIDRAYHLRKDVSFYAASDLGLSFDRLMTTAKAPIHPYNVLVQHISTVAYVYQRLNSPISVMKGDGLQIQSESSTVSAQYSESHVTWCTSIRHSQRSSIPRRIHTDGFFVEVDDTYGVRPLQVSVSAQEMSLWNVFQFSTICCAICIYQCRQ